MLQHQQKQQKKNTRKKQQQKQLKSEKLKTRFCRTLSTSTQSK